MAATLCLRKLKENAILVQFQGNLTLIACVLNLTFSIIATIGNLLVIRALRKASTIPVNVKKLFLNLAVSDLAVGLIAQLMFGIIMAIMLDLSTSGSNSFEFLCPTILSVSYFFIFLLTCASFLTVTIIAVDRVLAIFLHLRYQELVTSRCIAVLLVLLWMSSFLAAFVYIYFPNQNNIVVVTVEFIGLLVTTTGYVRIYKVVKYHRNQIQIQTLAQQQNNQENLVLRQRKSTISAMFVHIFFLMCFFPNLCCIILLRASDFRLSFLAVNHVSGFLVLLNSSLNPVVYCWRYREIREIVKSSLKKGIAWLNPL